MPRDPLTLTALVTRSVALRGDALAVKDAHQACSYRELHARAVALAHALRERGIGLGDTVAIYADRTVPTVVAVLAVLHAGGAFVPISLDTPPARLDFILRDANPKLLLTDRTGRGRLARREMRLATLAIDDVPAGAHDGDGDGPVVDVKPDDLAYAIYTSGTTGEPKGILIEHGSIARRFHDWDRVFALSASPLRVLQLAKLGFDVFTADVVKALCSGGTLVLCPSEAMLDPAQLYRRLIDDAIDYVDIVPAMIRPLMDHLEASGQDLAGLRIINCGADLWRKDEYQRCRRITKVARLFNGYGVTECTVESTLFEDDGATLDGKSTLPIGRALASDQILILDEALAPVPPGVTGQLCIGGPCVARGYLNRPELNQRAFFLRTADDGTSVRFYQTGDLGRVDAHGIFEFLGRADLQIKINGHRIELEEIERVLERVPAVRQAVVCFDDTRRALTAFVRTMDGVSLKPSESAAVLAQHLPPYMIPSRIVTVAHVPLNQNGKIDRARLVTDDARSPEVPFRRTSHDLHQSRSVAELRERLRRRDIDLISLVHEFVKPTARFGLLIGGALAEGTATEVSALELMVLLEDAHTMKRRTPQIAGHVVAYHPVAGTGETRVSLSIDGLDIRVDFLVAGAAGGARDAEVVSRMMGDWTVHGRDVVERWRLQRPR